jgi:hypothetical protein
MNIKEVKFKKNYIYFNNNTKKYFCHVCNLKFIKPNLHLKKDYHQQNLKDFKDYIFIVYF